MVSKIKAVAGASKELILHIKYLLPNDFSCGMSKKMKVLVTGGAGFIGSNLALRLEKLGHDVWIVDDFSSANQQNLSSFQGKVLHHDLSASLTVPKDFEVIFHQASITDPRYPNDEVLWQKNVGGFEKILDFALRNKARLVYASTAGLYGNGPVPMQEEQEKHCMTAYALSKLKMDEIAGQFFSELPIIGLRYFNVFGPGEKFKGQAASMVFHLWTQMASGERPRLFKWGEQIRDFVYVDDVVEANLCALNAPSGIYNVGTGEGTTFNQLVNYLNEAMGTKYEPHYFEMPFSATSYQNHTWANTEKAEKMLGFKAGWKTKQAVSDYVNFLEKMKG